MTPAATARNSNISGTEKRLAVFMAHAVSQPLRMLGQSEASLSTYAVFWCVAAKEAPTQVEVAKATGLSTKTVSRVIARLGMGEQGLGLVRQMRDKGDRRRKRLVLSSKGTTLLKRMLSDLRNINQ